MDQNSDQVVDIAVEIANNPSWGGNFDHRLFVGAEKIYGFGEKRIDLLARERRKGNTGANPMDFFGSDPEQRKVQGSEMEQDIRHGSKCVIQSGGRERCEVRNLGWCKGQKAGLGNETKDCELNPSIV
jgi:hypothetical protein